VTAEDLGVPDLFSLVNVRYEEFAPDECPMCQGLVPINTGLGHGKDYQATQPDYPGGYRR
jgi:hypothetical protein